LFLYILHVGTAFIKAGGCFARFGKSQPDAGFAGAVRRSDGTLVEMPPEVRSVFDVRTLRLVDFLRAKGFAGRHHADLVVAITFRSFALAHLVQSDPVKGWIISADERGMTRLHAEIVRAAAEEALVEDPDSAVVFDVRSFTPHLLFVAQPQGRA
jgi:hypothetical protein